MVLEVVLPVPVLVVEDEEIIQLRLRKILIDLGYTDDDFSGFGGFRLTRWKWP